MGNDFGGRRLIFEITVIKVIHEEEFKEKMIKIILDEFAGLLDVP